MSEVKVNKISPRSGTTVTLGDSGDTIAITSGASLTGFTSTGIDDNATSTAVTLDSSGNVLVGKTSSNYGTAGVQLQSNGELYVTRNGGNPVSINRLSSDGVITNFAKDGTVVGSIGTYAGDLIIGTTDTGLRFDDGASAYIPWNTSTNLATNGTISLGFSTVKYKDLYLSGNIYLGGTGSANALDDYEEGTWTPVIRGSTTAGTASYTTRVAKYVKIGKQVFITTYIHWNSGTGTGNLQLYDLPFASESTVSFYQSATIGYFNNITLNANSTPIAFLNHDGSSNIFFSQIPSGGGINPFVSYDSAGEIMLSAIYRTN
jgi:hypothetical protein